MSKEETIPLRVIGRVEYVPATLYQKKCAEAKQLREALTDIAELQNNDQDADIARKALAETGPTNE